jgi:hypothetical protein
VSLLFDGVTVYYAEGLTAVGVVVKLSMPEHLNQSFDAASPQIAETETTMRRSRSIKS